MLLLLKKNIFQFCFCIKENDSSHIKLSALEPLEDLVAYDTSSAEDRMAGVTSWLSEEPLHFHSRSHSKKCKFASYVKNINAFANLLAISFPQAGKQNSADASPDDSTLMSITYAIDLI